MPPQAGELRTVPLFHGLDDAELGDLAKLFVPVTVNPDVPLFLAGSPAVDLYLLTAGRVTLDRIDPIPGELTAAPPERFELYPVALIGELGAITSLPRSTTAHVVAGSTLWSLSARVLQEFFHERQESGVQFLVNLLGVVADKVHRDQSRLADMRGNLVRTQKELKRLRELVLDADDTAISAPVHDTLDKLITHNRRVNYRVEPPATWVAALRFDHGTARVVDLSRTHVSIEEAPVLEPGSWYAGVLQVEATQIPISGRVHRTAGERITLELDIMIDEYAALLEGYLTRAQLLDVLV